MSLPGGQGAGGVIWIVGRPGVGKTTLARGLIDWLNTEGIATLWLDSDDLRTGLFPHLGYSEEDRETFYRGIAYLARLGCEGGSVTIVSATASRRAYRLLVRDQVTRYVEIWLEAEEEELRRRDPKGLYAQADRGELENLPGYKSDFEAPENADLVLHTDRESPDRCIEEAVEVVRNTLGLKV